MCEFCYFQLAAKLNRKHKKELKKKQCHFRGGFGGVSLISLHHWTPECGTSNLKDERQAIEELKVFKPKIPDRITPEKQLQSWIINQVLFNEPPSFWKGKHLSFLTSELRLKDLENDRLLVNDILAIDDKGALWVIELKSDRELKTLIDQVEGFEKIIRSKEEVFCGLVEALLAPTNQWDRKSIKKMIIWPSTQTGKALDSTIETLANKAITSVTYTGPSFQFSS